MNWNKDRSIMLSQVCVLLFGILLAVLDIGCYWAVGWFISLRGMHWQSGFILMVCIYLCSIFGWTVLVCMWKLLSRMKAGQVFTDENVRYMRIVSWCCATAGLICLLSSISYLPLLIVAMAAAFMALIVRIVKNVFQQANAMKSELDLTV